MVLDLEIVDARTSEPRVLSTASVPTGSRDAVVRAVRGLLAGPLGLSNPRPARDRSQPEQESPAYALYTTGLGLLQRVYEEGNLERATLLFEEAVSVDSSFVRAHAGLCQARWERYVRSGNPDHAQLAADTCEGAVARSRMEPRALVALGRTQLQFGRAQEAEATLRRAISLETADADAHRWLGRTLEDQRRLGEAASSYQEAIRLQPDVWLYEFELGLMLSYAERHEEAVEHFERVIELSPNNYRGYNMLGFTHLGANRIDEAEAALRASLDIRENVLAYRNLGLLYVRDRQYERAIEELRRGLELAPDDWWSWRWMAHARHWTGQPEAAAEAWQRVIDLTAARLEVNPNDADALGGSAEALGQLGDIELGREHLDRLMVLGETTGYNAFLVGRLYEMLGSRAAAVRQLQRAMELGVSRAIIQRDPWLTDLVSDSVFDRVAR